VTLTSFGAEFLGELADERGLDSLAGLDVSAGEERPGLGALAREEEPAVPADDCPGDDLGGGGAHLSHSCRWVWFSVLLWSRQSLSSSMSQRVSRGCCRRQRRFNRWVRCVPGEAMPRGCWNRGLVGSLPRLLTLAAIASPTA